MAILNVLLALLIIVLLSPPIRKVISGYYFRRAEAESAGNNFLEFEKNLRRSELWYKDQPDLMFVKYKMFLSSGKEKMAYDCLMKAVEGGHDDLDSLYTLARLHNKYGNTKDEFALYKRILEKEPNHPESNYCLAMFYDQKMHDKENTIKHLKIARDNLPADNIWRKRCDEILSRTGGNQ